MNGLSKLGAFDGGDTGWPLFQKPIERVAGVNNLEHVLEHGCLQSTSFDYNDKKTPLLPPAEGSDGLDGGFCSF
jgi:hypothetical protein